MNTAIKEFINSVVDFSVDAVIKLIIVLIVLPIGLKLAKIITKKVMKSRGMQRVDKSVQSFMNNLIIIVLDVVVVVTAALILGIPATSFVALLGTAGVAIGLALQGAFSNFAGGIMILIFRPFKVGHYIESGDLGGTVHDISIFYTVLTTPDNKHITIPNGTLMNSSVINYSAEPTRRVDIVFSVHYDSDVEKVKDILLKQASLHEYTLTTPEPFARITGYSANSIDFALRVWCASENYWDLKFDLTESIKKEFDKNNIVIPYQQIDVHLDK
ncbi:MAG: mechanosensitive ion channel [Ruminococcaceae bacterium]|nr:mechanosensitive ion channel [Oscillospiraceae bacterium]